MTADPIEQCLFVVGDRPRCVLARGHLGPCSAQAPFASNELLTRLTEAATRVYEDGSRIGCYVNPDEAATLLAAMRTTHETGCVRCGRAKSAHPDMSCHVYVAGTEPAKPFPDETEGKPVSSPQYPCICREWIGDALKIEDGCPVHSSEKSGDDSHG